MKLDIDIEWNGEGFVAVCHSGDCDWRSAEPLDKAEASDEAGRHREWHLAQT